MSGGIAERRLRPLWDAIDSRQYKSALKLATALQSKHPDSAYALTLRALVLERLGKSDEALLLCRQAKDMVPVDDLTLSTLQMVYQRLDRLDEASVCYESACAKSPGNMELLMALFNSYVRQYNFVKQQQTAMKMYKGVSEEKYLLWAVCSIYLQASPSNPASLQLMTLAEALVKKRIDTNGTVDLEALRIYIAVLQQQGKYETALEVLSGRLGTLFTMRLELLRLQGDLLLQSRQYHRAATIFKEILLFISSDDWTAVKDLIEASLENSSSSQHITDQEKCTRLDELSQVFCDLQNIEHPEFVRAPWLAMVEVESRRPGRDLMVLAASVLDYFKRFGHLSSFFSDVRCYLNLLDAPSKRWLAGQLRKAPSDPSSDHLKVLRRQISAFQVLDSIGAELSALDTAKLFKCSLPYSKDLDPQDSIIGEELLAITANLLIKAYLASKMFGFLLEAIAVLEYGLGLRRFNFRYKVMLISLYSTVNAVPMSLRWFKDLDIKSILLEVATHHILPELVASPLWLELESLLKDVIKFNEDYPNDAAEMAILGYKHCNYTKVLEFVELKEKFRNSHQYLLVRVELVLLSLKKGAEKLEDAEGIIEKLDCGLKLLEWSSLDKISNLSFNEDFEVRPWWSPVPDENLLIVETGGVCDTDDKVVERQNRWRANIRRRCLVPRLLYLAITLSPGKGGWEGCSDFMQLFNSYVEGFGVTSESAAQFLSEYVSTTKCSLMDVNSVVTIALFWLVPQLSKSVDEILLSLALVEDVVEVAMKDIGRLTAAAAPGETIGTWTRLSVLFAFVSETLGWFSLCLQAWIKRLQPVARKKKKASEGADQKVVDALRSLVATICKGLDNVSPWLTERADSPQAVEVGDLLSLLRSSLAAADGNVTPGRVLQILEAPDDGFLEKWEAGDFVRRMVDSQRGYLTGVRDMCMSRLRFFKSLKF